MKERIFHHFGRFVCLLIYFLKNLPIENYGPILAEYTEGDALLQVSKYCAFVEEGSFSAVAYKKAQI